MQETLKALPGYPFIYISPEGKAYFKTAHKYDLLPISDLRGVPVIRFINSEGRYVTIRMHRAVALLYVPNPSKHKRIWFKDNNRMNIHKDNLYWVKGTPRKVPMPNQVIAKLDLKTREPLAYYINMATAAKCNSMDISSLSRIFRDPINNKSAKGFAWLKVDYRSDMNVIR